MTGRLERLLGWAWTALAAGLVLLAVASTAVRLLLPRLDRERPAVEAWVGEWVGAAVSIGSLTPGWHRGLPVLAAHRISLRLPDASGPEVLRFEHADADIDLWASLRERQIQLGHLTLRGLSLQLRRLADGTIAIEGYPVHDAKFMRWLLAQPALALVDAKFTLRDARGQFQPITVEGVNLALAGADRTLDIEGGFAAVDAVDGPLALRAVLPRRAGGPTPRIRLAGQGLDLAKLAAVFGHALPSALALTGDLRCEITLPAAGRLQLGFELSGATLEDTAGARLQLGLAGAMAGTRGALDLQLRALELDGGARQPIDWRGHVRRGDGTLQITGSADRVPLTLVPLLARFATAAEWPAQVRDGELSGLRFGVADAGSDPRFYARGQVAALALAAGARWPALTGFGSDFALNDHALALGFRNAAFVVEDTRHLRAPLTVQTLNGRFTWQREATADEHFTAALQGFANTLPITLQGTMARTPLALGEATLDVAVGTGDVTQVKTLLPQHLMTPHGEEWLDGAFSAGLLRGGRLHLRGPLTRFPFDAGDGEFAAFLAVQDTVFRYAKGWPTAHDVDGVVRFDGRRLTGALTRARFADSPLRKATFEIADYLAHERFVTVAGTVAATYADLLDTLHHSPLKPAAVNQLDAFELGGPLELGLDMRLSLRPGGEKTVLGTLGFDGNTLHSERHHFTLEDLHGRLTFTREDWYGDDLTALLGGTRVGLVVNGGIGDHNYDNEFRLTGMANAAEVLAQLQQRVPALHAWLAANGKLDALAGEMAWKALLVSPHPAGGATPPPPPRLTLESSLEGMSIALPWPFGKATLERRPLRLDMTLNAPTDDVVRVSYGDDVQIALARARDATGARHLQRLETVFGAAAAPTLAHEGVYVHGQLRSLPLGEWAMLTRRPDLPPSGLPMRFDVDVARLHTLGQEFEQVSLRGHQDPIAWRVQMTSAPAAGEITVPRDLARAPLTLNFERLWLKSPARDNTRHPLDPRALPNLVLACASFKYNALDLGQASLATTRAEHGLHLQSLVFQSPAFQVQASGDWTLQSGAHSSQFSIQLKGEELGEILQRFGYNARAISGGRTQLEIEATWPGTPGEFTLDRLDGSFGMHVQKGRFLDIEPGGGRLFGLLSLQSLPRRLSLDFADLFQKGYAFDRIEGWFELENGNAYTNSLFMEGPSSRVEVTGRTGLAAHDYDQRATVTPALSKSIPLASALFGPAGIGVGAAIYLGQKVFKDIPEQVDRFLQKQYSITGSWSEPKVEKL